MGLFFRNWASTTQKMAQRLRIRRRCTFNTRQNRRRVISKTPGGKLVYIHPKKLGSVTKCGNCKDKLRGIKAARPRELSRFSLRLKKTTRPYGGSLCSKCVRERVVRAFLIEEQKLVVRILKAKQNA